MRSIWPGVRSGGRQRIQQHGLRGLAAIPAERRLDRQLLHANVRAVQTGELTRQFANVAGTDSSPVNQTRNLDTATRSADS